MVKKLISIILVVFTSIGFITPTLAKEFSDVSSTKWYDTAIEFVSDNNYMTGYKDGSFKPSGTLTRAEACVLLDKLNGYESYMQFAGGCVLVDFKDYESIPKWAHNWIEYAVRYGYISGYTDNTIRANNKITREEFCVMLNKALNINEEVMIDMPLRGIATIGVGYPRYEDIATFYAEDATQEWINQQISAGLCKTDACHNYSRESIMYMTQLGIVSGDQKGYFNPTKTITRAEAAQMIYKITAKGENANMDLYRFMESGAYKPSDVYNCKNGTAITNANDIHPNSENEMNIVWTCYNGNHSVSYVSESTDSSPYNSPDELFNTMTTFLNGNMDNELAKCQVYYESENVRIYRIGF